MVSWVGLRGAAPIVLATFPLLYGVAIAPVLFNMVFYGNHLIDTPRYINPLCCTITWLLILIIKAFPVWDGE